MVPPKMRRLLRLAWSWLPLLCWMGILYWLSAQPKLPHPARKMGLSDYVFDYSAHAFSFGLLTVLAWRAFSTLPARQPSYGPKWERTLILWAGLLAMLYAMFDELHQRMVPGRWSSLKDWLADVAGVAVAMSALCLWLRWRGPLRRRTAAWKRRLNPDR